MGLDLIDYKKNFKATHIYTGSFFRGYKVMTIPHLYAPADNIYVILRSPNGAFIDGHTEKTNLTPIDPETNSSATVYLEKGDLE